MKMADSLGPSAQANPIFFLDKVGKVESKKAPCGATPHPALRANLLPQREQGKPRLRGDEHSRRRRRQELVSGAGEVDGVLLVARGLGPVRRPMRRLADDDDVRGLRQRRVQDLAVVVAKSEVRTEGRQ